jgi:hypothetical protein
VVSVDYIKELSQKIRNSANRSDQSDNESDDDVKITKKMAIDMANDIIEK